jgi:predicted TIM-barrel fold metal-dependent hydrolase
MHDWTVESFRPWVLAMIELFGVERIIFGTNWPVDAVYASYLETVDAYRVILAQAGFSRADQARMLNGNAEAFYRI